MKIVIATPLYPPELGGPATYAKILFEELPKQGIEVDLVKFGDVRHLPKIVRHAAYFFRVRHALAKADAVLALDPVSVGLPTCVAAWTLGKPFVVKVVGDYAWEQGRQRFGIDVSLDEFPQLHPVPLVMRFFRKVQTGVANNARLVIVPSEYLKGIVVSWGVPAKKVRVIYNAVPQMRTVGAIPPEVVALPRPLVVTAGRLVPWKHIDGVIDAVATLRKSTPQASLVVIGDGPERAPLAARAKDALDNNYVFTGALSHKDLLAVLAHADVFVLNSSYEGLSHVLIEALSLGVPIVTTHTGGNPEIVHDNENGLLVPVNDTTALVHALSRILSDEPLRSRLSATAKKTVARFSQNVMLDETATVLEKTTTTTT